MNNGKMEISKAKTLVAFLIIPIELILGNVVKVIDDQLIRVIIVTLLFFTGFSLAIFLYHDVLKRDWKLFKEHIWRNLLTAIIGLVAAPVILYGTRFLTQMLFGATAGGASGDSTGTTTVRMALITAIASLDALMAPFTEEIIARHALFYQFKGRGAVTVLMFFFSAIFFGLIHWNNFNGNVVEMIPYMMMGAWFSLLYLYSKNIWVSITTHFLFDVMTPVASIFMLIITIIQH